MVSQPVSASVQNGTVGSSAVTYLCLEKLTLSTYFTDSKDSTLTPFYPLTVEETEAQRSDDLTKVPQ